MKSAAFGPPGEKRNPSLLRRHKKHHRRFAPIHASSGGALDAAEIPADHGPGFARAGGAEHALDACAICANEPSHLSFREKRSRTVSRAYQRRKPVVWEFTTWQMRMRSPRRPAWKEAPKPIEALLGQSPIGGYLAPVNRQQRGFAPHRHQGNSRGRRPAIFSNRRRACTNAGKRPHHIRWKIDS